jgi:hypothetical protein
MVRLRQEELERAQRGAQEQREANNPAINLRLPLGPSTKKKQYSDRSSHLEEQIQILEDLILQLTVSQRSSKPE